MRNHSRTSTVLPVLVLTLRGNRTSSKRHFVNPSLAVAALRTGPDGLLADFETFGFLFESLCTRDMRVYAQVNEGNVYHYRDKNNLESDLIIQLNNGQWAPVEVKMGSRQIDEAANNLKKLCKYIDIQKMGAPAFMMALTAEGNLPINAMTVYLLFLLAA